MRISSKILVLMCTVIVLMAVGLSAITYRTQRRALLDGVDARLLAAAHLAKASVPRDYHDRITGPESVSSETYHEIVDTYNRLCLNLGLQYLWSLLRTEEGTLVFTSATSAGKNVLNNDYAEFFEPHAHPQTYARALETLDVQYTTFQDRRGAGRMVILPGLDARSRPYLFAASVSTDWVANVLQATLLRLFVISLGVLLGAVILSYAMARSLSRPIERLTRMAKRMAAGDLDQRIQEGGSREVSSLSASLRDMGRATREKLDLLVKSETRFRHISEGIGEGVAVLDAEGRHLWVNQTASDILGYRREELIGQPVYDVLAGDEVEKARTRLRKRLAGEAVPEAYELRIIRKDGEERVLGVAAQTIAYDGQPALQAVVRDITEWKQTDRSLRQTQFAVDHAQDAILRLDQTGRFTYVNQAACAMLGYSRHELLNMFVFDIDELLTPENWPEHWARMRVKGHSVMESVHRTQRGVRLPVEIVGHYEEFEGEAFVFAYVRDITARLAAEGQSRELAAAVSEAAESILITDADGKIEYVNPYFESVTGYTAAEVIGKNPSILSSGKQDAAFYESMWRMLRRGETWRGLLTNRKKDGALFEEAAAISPVHDEKGRIVNFVAVKRDVTHERTLERQINQSQKMAAVGQLAHRVAHDFTNILLVIMGNTQMVKQKVGADPKLAQHLDRITDVANRMSAFTAELMAFAQPAQLVRRRMPLRKALLGLEEILRRTKPETVQLHLDGMDCPAMVDVDPTHLEQALVHLAINAMDAMPEGGVLTIAAEVLNLSDAEKDALQAGFHESRRHKGDFCAIRVSDTGQGIDEAALPRIFEPFFTTRDRKQNAGLGLATVYRIVEQHNGVIRAASQPGEGAVFTIYLPVTDAGERGAAAASSRRE